MPNQELVQHDEEQALATEQNQPQNMLEVIYRAATDPRVNIQKLEALLHMKERIEAREAEVEFNQALARLMPKLPRIEKHGVIRDNAGAVRSRFAKYEDVDAIIRPLLAEEGFAISFDTDMEAIAKHIKVIGTLSHRMGHSRNSQVTLPMESAVIKGSQLVGATVSFGKRYCVFNLLNLVAVDQDTDGQSMQTISDEQAMRINTLLTDTKANVSKFLEWAGVERVEDILLKDHRKVMTMLEAKARK